MSLSNCIEKFSLSYDDLECFDKIKLIKWKIKVNFPIPLSPVNINTLGVFCIKKRYKIIK